MGDRILITGCNGFVARYLALYLKEKDSIVYGIDLQNESSLDFIEYSKIDIRDIEKVKTYVSRHQISQIYHLAAIADPRLANKEPSNAISINVNGSVSFFEVCKDFNNISLIVIGSATEYKQKKGNEIIYTEDDVLDANTIYGATKIAAESIGRAYAKNYQINVKFTRSSNHTGPGQSTAYVLSNFAKQCADIARNRKSPEIYVGNIDLYRDFLDVEDVVEAYYAIMNQGKAGTVYNVSSINSYRIRDLLLKLISFTGRYDIKIIIDETRVRPGESEKIHCDSHLLYSDTGWKPKIQINDTLLKLYKFWYEQ